MKKQMVAGWLFLSSVVSLGYDGILVIDPRAQREGCYHSVNASLLLNKEYYSLASTQGLPGMTDVKIVLQVPTGSAILPLPLAISQRLARYLSSAEEQAKVEDDFIFVKYILNSPAYLSDITGILFEVEQRLGLEKCSSCLQRVTMGISSGFMPFI